MDKEAIDAELDIVFGALDLYRSKKYIEALVVATPFADRYSVATSVCILANMRLGNLVESDRWLIVAGNLNAREMWIESQETDLSFAILCARLDALTSSNLNSFLSGLEAVEFSKFLIEGFHEELSLHKSVGYLRRIWLYSNEDSSQVVTYFLRLLEKDSFAEVRLPFLKNLGFLLNCSLSGRETEQIMRGLMDALGIDSI